MRGATLESMFSKIRQSATVASSHPGDPVVIIADQDRRAIDERRLIRELFHDSKARIVTPKPPRHRRTA
jgi:hypothetical protein